MSGALPTDGPKLSEYRPLLLSIAYRMIGSVAEAADTLDTAAELAKGCPTLLHGGMVEVRPFCEGIPGMK
jgi:hypothetical protein